jgi:ABC-type nitrate/sulfonate/bicarbonate transport system substrate-binding protein
MQQIQLAFKAFDVHEMLCHAIAEAAGLYAEADLSVTLVDTTFVPDEALPENTFHVACGAALTSFLAGRRRKVVFIACDKPMFWLYGRAGITSLKQLGQARVATFPDVAPPSHFLRQFFTAAGVAPGLLPARDDIARLALLTSASVDAALLSSLYLPHDVEARGPARLAFIGESLRLPSTGLAVSSELHEEKPDLVASMVKIFQQSMKYVYDDNDTVLRTVLVDAFGMSAQGLNTSIQTVRDCYNPFGYSNDSLLQGAVEKMAATTGLASRAPEDLYEFKYIKSNS